MSTVPALLVTRHKRLAAAATLSALGVLGVLGASAASGTPAAHARASSAPFDPPPGTLPPVFLPPVQPPVGLGRIFGVVTAFTPATSSADGSLTLLEADGTTVTVTTTSATRFVSLGSGLGYGARRGVEAHPAATSPPVAVVQVGDDATVEPSSSTSEGGQPATTTGTGSTAVVAGLVVIEQAELAGTVVSVSGTTVVIADAQLFRHTIDLQPGVAITQGSQSVTTGAIEPGAQIVASGTLDSTETVLQASSVRVELQGLAGTVGTVTGTSFTVTTPDSNAPVTVTTTASTIYYAGGVTATIAAVQSNVRVLVLGTRQAGGGFVAETVTVLPGTRALPVASGDRHGRGGGAGATSATGTTGATGTAPVSSTSAGATDGRARHHGQGGQGGSVEVA